MYECSKGLTTIAQSAGFALYPAYSNSTAMRTRMQILTRTGYRSQAVSCLLSHRVRCPTDCRDVEDKHAKRYPIVLDYYKGCREPAIL